MSARILVGVVSEGKALNGCLSGVQRLSGSLYSGTQRLSCALATAYAMNANVYTGDYEVTPKTTAQELLTRQKFMADDVTVYAIPYYEVGNNSGGSTVYIGGKDEILIE